MSWFWKDVDDKDSAADATRMAVGVSYFVAGVSAIVAVASIVSHKPILGLDGWTLVDAAIFAIVGWRISRLSRAWTVVGLCLYIVEVISSISQRGPSGIVLTVIFIIAYINAVRGVFAYHRFVKLENAQPAQSPSLG